jgi:AbrB family looped-hinge helix DNA binding protein
MTDSELADDFLPVYGVSDAVATVADRETAWRALLDVDLLKPRGYTASMTQRVGAKGQVVIPKQMRDALGLQPGAEVDFERDGDSVRVMAAGAAATQGLRGRYAASGMASALLADRRREPR